jgi:hypothetical protein
VNIPTPVELLQEKGVIGEILRQLHQSSHTVLKKAEAQDDPWSWLAEWVKKNPVIHWHKGTVKMRDSECAALEKEGFKRTDVGVYSVDPATRRDAKVYQGVREIRFNFHEPDSTSIIMRIVMDGCWPDDFRKTFEAAKSQWEAELRLAEIARGGGSISQSWRLKLLDAQKIGDLKLAGHWGDKITGSILQWERGRQWLLYDNFKGLSAPVAMREVAKQKYQSFYEADVRRLGRKKADDKWKNTDNLSPVGFKRDSDSDKIAEAMTTSWLTLGHNGFPGLCFMSDELLAKLLGYTLPLPSLLNDSGTFRKRARPGRSRGRPRPRPGTSNATAAMKNLLNVHRVQRVCVLNRRRGAAALPNHTTTGIWVTLC